MLCTALLLGTALTSSAHDPGLSSLELRLAGQDLLVTLAIAPADARLLEPAGGDALAALVLQSIELQADGARLAGRVEDIATDADAGTRVVLRFEGRPGGRIALRSAIPARLARGHKQLVSVRAAGAEVIADWMLDAAHDTITMNPGPLRGASSPARQFGMLGLTHILGGFDHLLFVGALLLGVRRMAAAVKTVTAFTVAHSITLAAAALRIAHAPAAIVEPLIAASIVYVAVENLVRREAGARWPLTFAFGLVHGFGFAGAIEDLGLEPAAGIVAPLFWFNAGVEAGQILVVAASWPLVLLLTTPRARRWSLAPACSILIGAAGTYWLLERTLP